MIWSHVRTSHLTICNIFAKQNSEKFPSIVDNMSFIFTAETWTYQESYIACDHREYKEKLSTECQLQVINF